MADRKVFDVRFDFSMSKSPWGQVLSRFGWIGDGFIRVDFSKKVFFYPFMGLYWKTTGRMFGNSQANLLGKPKKILRKPRKNLGKTRKNPRLFAE